MHDRMNTKGRFPGLPVRSTPALPDAMYGAVQRHQITSDVEKFGGADLKSQCDPDPVFTSKSALYGHREIRISPYKTTAYRQDGLDLSAVGKA